jgi:phenylpyruvate tautomerase PptA (4-oxalocrotonate tautomerase family)
MPVYGYIQNCAKAALLKGVAQLHIKHLEKERIKYE